MKMIKMFWHLVCLCSAGTLAAYNAPDQVFAAIWQQVQEHTIDGEKEMVVVVLTYNNARWCIRNIASILDQEYQNFTVLVIDDACTDDTVALLRSFLANHARGHLVTLQRNKKRRGAAANWYYTIQTLPDHIIVANVDGDDHLIDDEVLKTINRAFDDPQVWLTCGQYKLHPEGRLYYLPPPSRATVHANSYRKAPWFSSHLRTYYAWLFKKIDRQDFMRDGIFLSTSCDRAFMLPMLEMAGGRFQVMHQALYWYNTQNQLSDWRVNLKQDQSNASWVMHAEPYEPLAPIMVRESNYATSYPIAAGDAQRLGTYVRC